MSDDELENKSKTLSNAAFTSYISSQPANLEYFHINDDGSATLPMQICTWAAKNVPTRLTDRASQNWSSLLNTCGQWNPAPIGKLPQVCADVTEEMIAEKAGPKSNSIITATYKLTTASDAAKTKILGFANNCCGATAAGTSCTPKYAGNTISDADKKKSGPDSNACLQDIAAEPAVKAAQNELNTVSNTAGASNTINLQRTCGCYMNKSIYEAQANSLESSGIALQDQDARFCYNQDCMFATAAARGTSNWDISTGIKWKPGGMPMIPARGKSLNEPCSGPSCISIQKLDTHGGSITNSSVNFQNTCSIAGSDKGNLPCADDSDCDFATQVAKVQDPKFPYTYKCVSTTGTNDNKQKFCRAKCTVSDDKPASVATAWNLKAGDPVGKCWPSLCGCKDPCYSCSPTQANGQVNACCPPGSQDGSCTCTVNNSCKNKKSMTCGGNGKKAVKMWNHPADGTAGKPDYYILPNTTCKKGSGSTDCYGNKTCSPTGSCDTIIYKCDQTEKICKQAEPGTVSNPLPANHYTNASDCAVACKRWFCAQWSNYPGSKPVAYMVAVGEGTEGKPQLYFHGFTGDQTQSDPLGGSFCPRASCLIYESQLKYYKTPKNLPPWMPKDPKTGESLAYKTSWAAPEDVGNIGLANGGNEQSGYGSHVFTLLSSIEAAAKQHSEDVAAGGGDDDHPLGFYSIADYGYDGGAKSTTPWFATYLPDPKAPPGVKSPPVLRYFLNIPVSRQWSKDYPSDIDEVTQNKICSKEPIPPINPVPDKIKERNKTIGMISGGAFAGLVVIITIILKFTVFKSAAIAPLKFISRNLKKKGKRS